MFGFYCTKPNILYIFAPKTKNLIAMVATREIEKRIYAVESDRVFSVADLRFPNEWYDNVRVKLSRMEKQGKVVKVGKGRYYRPRETAFGILPPSREEIVKDLLVKNGIPIGYLTGFAMWNKMGLTSQISNLIEIGTNSHRNRKRRGIYGIRFVLQPNPITHMNIPLLQILDAVKAVKKIPDTTVNETVKRLMALMGALSPKDVARLAGLTQKYPPQTRSLTGAILAFNGYGPLADKLKMTLHPATIYRIGVSENVLPNRKSWNIA